MPGARSAKPTKRLTPAGDNKAEQGKKRIYADAFRSIEQKEKEEVQVALQKAEAGRFLFGKR